MKKSETFRGFSAYRLWMQLPRIEVSHLPDVIMFGAGIALFYYVVTVGRSWLGPFTPAVEISRSLRALPAYAGYSLLRITIAYVLSLGFTLVYGYVAAYNPRAERFMIPLLDVLQSIPVLSFLPGVMLAMVALFPGRQLGVELGAILLIFTGQVWNMAFSFYASLKSIPQRDAGGGGDLPVQLVAALHADGAAFFGDRAGVELDDVGGRRVVRADGVRNVRAGVERFPAAGFGFVSANRGQRGRYDFDLLGRSDDGAGDRAAGSVCVAAGDRVGGEVQGGAGGKHRRSAIVGAEPGGAFERAGKDSGEDAAAAGERLLLHFARKHSEERPVETPAAWRDWLLRGLAVLVLGGIGYGVVRVAIILSGLGRAELHETALGLGATFLRVNVALLIGALWTIPVGSGDRFESQAGAELRSRWRRLRLRCRRRRCFP